MDDLVISKATLEDYVGIQNIHRNCDDPWHNIDECTAWVSKRLERGFYIQIAKIGNKIVGHAEWILTHDPYDKFLYLGILQIDEDFKRRGIGRKMIDDGFRIAREQGCHKIVTIPEADNTSNEFYKKCGFVSGRQIKNVILPTSDFGYSQNYTTAPGAPFRKLRHDICGNFIIIDLVLMIEYQRQSYQTQATVCN